MWGRAVGGRGVLGDSHHNPKPKFELTDTSELCICGCVMQCVAVCCSVLQCVAVCCSVLQCVAVCCMSSVDASCHTHE